MANVYEIDVFENLNGDYDRNKEAHNNTDELQKHLEKRMKAKEAMR
jgi:hypothetical protein